jgi:hypothetical protein
MVEAKSPREEKRRVRAQVEEIVGPTHQVGGRSDWRVTRDESLSVFLTFSKYEQLFYDVSAQDLGEWLSYPRAFVLFVMGDHTDVLIVPARVLKRLLRGRDTKGYGDYKLHITWMDERIEFRESQGQRLEQYYNSYQLLR